MKLRYAITALSLGLFTLSYARAEVARAPSILQPSIGMSLDQAPDEAWVPVVMLADPAAKSAAAPLLMGLARISDIQDGLPYQVNLYKIGASFAATPGLTLGAEVKQIRSGLALTPVCSAGTSGINCEPLSSVVAHGENAGLTSLGGVYRFNDSQVSMALQAGDSRYQQILNPYLPWPTVTGASLGLALAGQTNTRAGQFGLGLALNEVSVPHNHVMRMGEVRFDWMRGAFGTSFSTQILDIPGARSLFGSVDWGLTWRTPWQGVLSMGAKASVAKPRAGLGPNLRDDRDFEDRVPYVRYQQDL